MTDLRSYLIQFLSLCQDIGYGGLSFGWARYPGFNEDLWMTPYPETTGYAIPTLLDYSGQQRAISAGRWLQTTQHPDGYIRAYLRSTPAAFDTGMVLLGWVALRDRLKVDAFDDNIERAIKWLAGDTALTSFTDVYGGPPPGYFCRIAWPLRDAGAPPNVVARYLNLADNPVPDLSHFKVYVARGLWEMGEEQAAKDYAVRNLPHNPEGVVRARENADWICIPAVAQVAVLYYKMGWTQQADTNLNWLESHGSPLFGSYPRDGEYLPHIAPNWAAKFTLDAYTERDRHAASYASPDPGPRSTPDAISVESGRVDYECHGALDSKSTL